MFHSLGREVVVDHLRAQLVGAGDHRAARLARAEERVAVDLLGDRVVDDVARLEPLVLAAQPGVDPEGLDADDLLLLVAHRPRHVHDEDHHRVRLRHRRRAPRSVAPSSRTGTMIGLSRIVGAGHDLPPQRLPERALEVAQRLGAGPPDADVLVLLGDDPLLALRLDARQLQLLAHDLAPAPPATARPPARDRPPGRPPCRARRRSDRPCPGCRRRRPRPCPTPPRSLLPNRKRGQLICGSGIETRSLPLRPISSPCEMYLRRSCLIFPRTMSRKRRWSGSILSAIGSPRLEHQVDEPSRFGVVETEALAFRPGRDRLLQHAERARQHRHRLLGRRSRPSASRAAPPPGR